MSPTVRSTLALLTSLAATAPPSAHAQETLRLGRPLARAAEPLSAVSGLRELRDGSLLVSDALEEALYRFSPDLARTTAPPPHGQGPREIGQPDALFPLPADSTLLVDLGNGRLTVVDPDGAVARTEPIVRENPDGLTILMPGGTDGAGSIYVRLRSAGPSGGATDSARIARIDRASGALDTVAKIGLPAVRTTTSGGANERRERVLPVPFSPEDAWAVTPRGLVIARVADYHLELFGRGPEPVRGPAVSWTPVPVRRADRDAWISGLGGGLAMMVTDENGAVHASFRRGGPPPAGIDAGDFEWPDVKPPFTAGAVVPAPDGRVWIRREVPAGEAPRYDVFGMDGTRRATVTLPPDRVLVGLGAASAYLAERDGLDFLWLERYARPDL